MARAFDQARIGAGARRMALGSPTRMMTEFGTSAPGRTTVTPEALSSSLAVAIARPVAGSTGPEGRLAAFARRRGLTRADQRSRCRLAAHRISQQEDPPRRHRQTQAPRDRAPPCRPRWQGKARTALFLAAKRLVQERAAILRHAEKLPRLRANHPVTTITALGAARIWRDIARHAKNPPARAGGLIGDGCAPLRRASVRLGLAWLGLACLGRGGGILLGGLEPLELPP